MLTDPADDMGVLIAQPQPGAFCRRSSLFHGGWSVFILCFLTLNVPVVTGDSAGPPTKTDLHQLHEQGAYHGREESLRLFPLKHGT